MSHFPSFRVPEAYKSARTKLVIPIAEISSDLDAQGVEKDPVLVRKAVIRELVDLGMIRMPPTLAKVSPPDYLTVLLDGLVVGHMSTATIPAAVAHLRRLKVATMQEVRSLSCFTSFFYLLFS